LFFYNKSKPMSKKRQNLYINANLYPKNIENVT
jgi:hypothetical protein